MSTRLQIAREPIRTRLYPTATGFEACANDFSKLDPPPLTGMAVDGVVMAETGTRHWRLAMLYIGFISWEGRK